MSEENSTELPTDQEAHAMRTALYEPFAVAGVWTPWAETICLRCHGFTKRIQFDLKDTLPIPRPKGCGMANCDICGCNIWLQQKIAWEREMVGVLQTAFPAYRSDMQQTGGMNSAGAVAISGWDTEGAVYPYMMFVVDEEDDGDDPVFIAWLKRDDDDNGVTIATQMRREAVLRTVMEIAEDHTIVDYLLRSGDDNDRDGTLRLWSVTKTIVQRDTFEIAATSKDAALEEGETLYVDSNGDIPNLTTSVEEAWSASLKPAE